MERRIGRAWLLALGLVLAACTGASPEDAASARRIRAKAEAAKTGVRAAHQSGTDVSELMGWMREVRPRLQAGDPEGAEALLDRVLDRLESAPAWPAPPDLPAAGLYTAPRRIEIRGYDGHAMEPFLSRDGAWLFFNDRNAPEVDTDLHYAEHIDDHLYAYRGELPGAGSKQTDAVASLDRHGNFFFITTRSYFRTFRSIHRGRWTGAGLAGIEAVAGNVSRGRKPWLNMDAEISADGDRLYFTDNEFGAGGLPKTSNLRAAARIEERFEVLPGSDRIFARVNSDALEYAPATSPDQLSLYFTRADLEQLEALRGGAELGIYRAHRSRLDEPFGTPVRIESIRGFVEAPTLAPDGTSLAFHRNDGGRFQLYRVERQPGR